jgi:hypothetical protein
MLAAVFPPESDCSRFEVRYMRRIFAALLGSALCSSAYATTFYGVGNSLLADSYIHINSLSAFAAARGHTHASGYHIVSGASLRNIWDQSVNNTWGTTYGSSPSRYDNALAQEWDQFILEPYQDSAATEVTAAVKFIDFSQSNRANQDARYLVFAPWAGMGAIGGSTYAEVWNAPYSGGDSGQARSAAYHANILDSLRFAKAGLEIDMIPSGHVFALVDERARAGEIPGLTDGSQLYRDELHAGRVGMYLSALTYYATLYKEDPRGLPIHSDYTLALPTQSVVVTPQMAPALQQAVYDVVFGNPQLTGVPEPTSLALVAGAGILALRRRP